MTIPAPIDPTSTPAWSALERHLETLRLFFGHIRGTGPPEKPRQKQLQDIKDDDTVATAQGGMGL